MKNKHESKTQREPEKSDSEIHNDMEDGSDFDGSVPEHDVDMKDRAQDAESTGADSDAGGGHTTFGS